MKHQGCLRHHAHLLFGLLHDGLPCSCGKCQANALELRAPKDVAVLTRLQQKRLFHILTAFITTFAMISYFAMAVNDGVSHNKIVIKESQKHFPDTFQTVYREVYWARYVDWCFTTPLLLLDLCLLAGLGGANILVAVVADIIMILTGLFAAFTVESGPKWGWYAMACIAYLVVVYQLAVNGRGIVQNKDKKTATFFSAIAGFTLILWTVYPMYVSTTWCPEIWTNFMQHLGYC